jgi:PAS domain S-box-containing protein
MSPLKATLFSRRGLLAWIVLLAGLVPTVLVWTALRDERERSAAAQFELHAREVIAAIEKRLRDHEQILLGGAGLFDASDNVTRGQWRTYVERLRLKENYPGIQGVGFSKVIEPAGLAEHIAVVRAEGFPQYTVRPPGERSRYTSIIYLEPFIDRNLAAFGYDMYSEATRRRAMQQAVDSNTTSITGKVKLVQETHGKEQAGFLMYVPVYRKNLPLTNEQERWQALLGYVYSPYRVEDLMRGILGESSLVVDFSLHDGETAATDALMHDSSDARAQESASPPRYSAARQIHAYGHTWTLTLRNRPAFETQFASPLDWLVPSLGAGISLLLFALILSLLSRREQALALAEDMMAKRTASEERFHQLFLHMGQGVVIHQSDGSIMDANPAAERILGLSLSQMRGLSSIDPNWRTIHEDGSHFPETEHPARVALRDGQPVTDVVMGVWNPETEAWRWIRMDAYPRDEGGGSQAWRAFSVFSDITDQRSAGLAVGQTRKLLSDVLAAASEFSIIATDVDGLITIFNTGSERLLGYTAEEMVGKQSPAMIHLSEEVMKRSKELSAVFDRPIEGFRVFVEIPERDGSEMREWTYVHKDGHPIPVALVVTPMRDTTGRISGYLGIAEDITERKRVDRMKSEFVSTVSHELRTPLTSISGALGLINGGMLGELTPQAQQMVEIAHKNSQRLSYLINDLLDMEKLMAGKLQFDLQVQPLMPLIDQAIRDNQAYADQRHVRLILTERADDAWVAVDPQRLQQVLANLLSNAAKFSPEGGVVEVSSQVQKDTVRVVVRDYGTGIPAAFHDRLFEKFAQADATDARQKGGTGLGLAITRELLERMGGRIGFESIEGEGARFFFELPLQAETESGTSHV